MAVSFDVKLIPLFDGSGDVVDWLEKLSLVCELQTPAANEALVIPLRLEGGASSVYRQILVEDRKSAEKVKAALKRAFAADKFAAYESFTERRLTDGESVDVYLADLQRLSSLFGGLSNEGLSCAFVAGLPESTKQLLLAGARMESLSLTEITDRARAILRDEAGGSGFSAAVRQAGRAMASSGAPHSKAPQHREGPKRLNRDRRGIRCFCCEGWGHIAAQCPSKGAGNAEREGAHAPASSRE